MNRIILIDNNTHKTLNFRSFRAFKDYCRKEGIRPKKSPISEDSYYIDSDVILPTGFKD